MRSFFGSFCHLPFVEGEGELGSSEQRRELSRSQQDSCPQCSRHSLSFPKSLAPPRSHLNCQLHLALCSSQCGLERHWKKHLQYWKLPCGLFGRCLFLWENTVELLRPISDRLLLWRAWLGCGRAAALESQQVWLTSALTACRYGGGWALVSLYISCSRNTCSKAWWCTLKLAKRPGMVLHTLNPSILETEAAGSLCVQVQPALYNQF